MIELAQHIESLLLENDCVIVPNFGGFVAHYVPASYIKKENLFLPPTRIVGFNPQLRLNDGVLVQSYMSVHDTSFSDATRLVEKEVIELIETLHEEGKVDLENIGEIHYNIYGNFEFVPYDYKITAPSLYGLDSFEMRELSILQQKESVLVPSNLSPQKNTYEINVNRTFIRNAVAMIAAVVLFFAFSTPIENTYIQKNNYAQLLPTELFEQFEKQSVAMTPVQVQPKIAQQKSKKTVINKGQIAKPVVVKEVKVVEPEAPVVKVSHSQVNNPFHIIVAGGISLKDAETIAKQVQAKGCAEAMVLRVSIRSFNNRKEATKQLLELRKNETYKSAWLLAK